MAQDDRWKTCKGTWDRLKWARLQKYGTAEDAAPHLGEKPGTYRTYEREPVSEETKSTALSHQKAVHFARKLGVRWQWLLQGEGEPFFDPDEDINEIVRTLHGLPAPKRKEWVQAIERLLKTGTGG